MSAFYLAINTVICTFLLRMCIDRYSAKRQNTVEITDVDITYDKSGKRMIIFRSDDKEIYRITDVSDVSINYDDNTGNAILTCLKDNGDEIKWSI